MRVVRLVAAVFAALVVAVVPGLPAYAHDGPVTLDVAGDGAGGVTVRALYTEDKHPVESGVLLMLSATGEGGRTVGPIQLNPSAEGRGFYTSGPVLTPGSWTVAVAAPAPHAGKASAKIEARVAQKMPPVPPAERRANSTLTGRFGWLWWLGGLVLVVLVLGAIAQSRTRLRRP
jgi:hypothetical protein